MLLRPVMFVFLALAAAPACATTGATRTATQSSDEAELAYQRAMDLYQDESWPEAAEAFRALQRAHGTSRFATLAELRLADVEFKQEHYTEALAAFRAWLRYHPTHTEAPYARFMIARCHVEQMPEDWFLTPPSWERDLSSARDAETALTRFLRDHGDSPQGTEARALQRRVQEILVRHEIYVANFYASRDHHAAAASRLLGVLSRYHDSGLESLALLRLGETYLRMARTPEARGAFSMLRESYPRSAEAEAAAQHLARVGPGPSTPVQPEEGPSADDTSGSTEDVTSPTPNRETTPPRRK